MRTGFVAFNHADHAQRAAGLLITCIRGSPTSTALALWSQSVLQSVQAATISCSLGARAVGGRRRVGSVYPPGVVMVERLAKGLAEGGAERY